MEFKYYCDKETPGTYRFQPDDVAVETLGQATIYIKKTGLKKLGIADPRDGLIVDIKGNA